MRLFPVLVQPDTPPEAKVNAPVELPMLVTAVPVVLIFPIPVTVNPPVPCSKPDPASTPTAVTAPLELTWNCEVEPTENKEEGLVVPTPTLPLAAILNSDVPEDEATLKGETPAEPVMSSLLAGEVVLIPTFPELIIRLA